MSDKEIIEAYQVIVAEQNKTIESLNQVIKSMTSYVTTQTIKPLQITTAPNPNPYTTVSTTREDK